MHRFFLAPCSAQASQIVLVEAEAYHASRVLRLTRGDPVTVLNGQGESLSCVIDEITRNEVHLTVLERRYQAPLPYQVTLLQAIPKGKVMEDIVEKATELGAARVIPLLTAHTEVHLDENQADAKVHRWRLTAVESVKQCGSPWLPQIERPTTLAAFIGRHELADLSLVASLQKDARHPRQFFQAYYAEHQRRPATLWAWIGPEGDFSKEELEAIQSAGGRPISLGPNTLRAGTAATYCLAMLSYELLEPQRFALGQSASGTEPSISPTQAS